MANEKYLEFLRDLHQQLQKTKIVFPSNIAKKHHVHQSACVILQEGGILKKEGSGRIYEYTWISPIIPNVKMAQQLMDRCNQKQRDYFKDYSKKQKNENKQHKWLDTKTVNRFEVIKNKEEPKTKAPRSKKSFSILWGLIKLDY
jgi:hypothetical protein